MPGLSMGMTHRAIQWRNSTKWVAESRDSGEPHQTVPTASHQKPEILQWWRGFRPGNARHRLLMTSLRLEPAAEAQEARLFVCRRERQTDRPLRWPAQVLSRWRRAEKASWHFQSLAP